jgi:phosphatidylserine decarboxylase
VLDPRDVKFYRNQQGYYWLPDDDPFTWRNRLPLARDALAEVLLIGGSLTLLTLVVAAFSIYWAIPLAVIAFNMVWFFRNPRRRVPTEPGLVVSPADGKIVAIEQIPYDEFIGGPAICVGIFLSVFNVHINRAPVAGRVVGLTYRRGKMLNARRSRLAKMNKSLCGWKKTRRRTAATSCGKSPERWRDGSCVRWRRAINSTGGVCSA